MAQAWTDRPSSEADRARDVRGSRRARGLGVCGCLGAGLLWLAASNGASAADSPAIVRREFLCDTAPFPSCHASTIVESTAGLLVAYFGGTHEQHADVCIYLSRATDSGWAAPEKVADGGSPNGPSFPCWNPVLFQPPRGPLHLYYKVGPDPQRWWGMLRTSPDGGKTWGDPQRLPEGILGPIKNKPLAFDDERWLSPSSTESPTSPSLWQVHFESTTDAGVHWVRGPDLEMPRGVQAIQPTVLKHAGNRLQALARTSNGFVYEAWSDDKGLTWSALAPTTLPNPNSGLDAVTLANGMHLLVYNPVPKGRTPLHLATSEDGSSWRTAAVLEQSPGEFSYPAIIQTADGLVHVTYTWNRKKISHVVVDPARLDARETAQP